MPQKQFAILRPNFEPHRNRRGGFIAVRSVHIPPRARLCVEIDLRFDEIEIAAQLSIYLGA
jgi:hypothetical protein